MLRHKTHYKRILELQETYQTSVEAQRTEFNRMLAMEYDLAYSEIAAKLRELFVDTNYELFHSSDSLLRSKIYAFMAHGLSMFHDKAYKGRPVNDPPQIEKAETKDNE